MRTSESGIKFIEGWEGLRLVRYLDSVGVPTIGYGTTAADIGTVPATCTQEQATRWLLSKLAKKYEPPVNALGLPLNQNQFDALVSFCYNLGPDIFSPAHTIGQSLRAKNYSKAADDLLLYTNGGLQGLVNRRQAERAKFLTPVTDVHQYSRYDNTPRMVLGKARRERHQVVLYDTLRAEQSSIKHPHRRQVNFLRTVMAWYAGRLKTVTLKHGMNADQRWRYEHLKARAAGKKIV